MHRIAYLIPWLSWRSAIPLLHHDHEGERHSGPGCGPVCQHAFLYSSAPAIVTVAIVPSDCRAFGVARIVTS